MVLPTYRYQLIKHTMMQIKTSILPYKRFLLLCGLATSDIYRNSRHAVAQNVTSLLSHRTPFNHMTYLLNSKQYQRRHETKLYFCISSQGENILISCTELHVKLIFINDSRFYTNKVHNQKTRTKCDLRKIILAPINKRSLKQL
jgi:hypothetical protein